MNFTEEKVYTEGYYVDKLFCIDQRKFLWASSLFVSLLRDWKVAARS